ncbi:MAG: hypothetical protein J5613_04845 [Alphaproteobacteria bacterium]|nr:hypothetical protein [Alphaproteobacteria bacterium]
MISTYGGWLRNKLNKSTFCTGTIARWDRGFVHKEAPDSNWYLFTAKHCTDQNGDGISDRNLRIKLQDGDEYDVTLVTAGNYDINKDSNVSEDWAIYSLPVNPFKESTDPYVENVYRNMVQYHGREVSTPNDKIPWIYADSNATRDNRPVRLIGYGSLKIMNDNEIAEFKEKYIAALEKAGVTDMSYENTGIENDNGVDYYQMIPASLVFSHSYASKIFDDDQLKLSRCFFRNNNNLCQGWGGNSGGPMIDDSNRLVSIVTRGGYHIGGDNHAQTGGVIYDEHDGTYEQSDVPVGHVYQLMGK